MRALSRRLAVDGALMAAAASWQPPPAIAVPPSHVCVTGANGYIGLHLVHTLLKAGCTVTAGVRNLDPARTHWLQRVAASARAAPAQLRFAPFSLSDAASLERAAKGCTELIHLASPYDLHPRQDAMSAIVNPAVQGACNAVRVARQLGLRRVVTCSSIFAAIPADGPRLPPDRLTTAADYTPDTHRFTPDGCAYALSKLEAEIASQALAKALGVDLVTLCPGQVEGPSLSPVPNPSWEALRLLASPPYRGAAVLSACFPAFADVRDVAKAHARALALHPSREPRRYLIATQTASPTFAEVTSLLGVLAPSDKLPERGESVPVLPPAVQNLVLAGLGATDPSLGQLLRAISVPPGGTLLVDVGPMRRELLPESIPVEKTIADWLESQQKWAAAIPADEAKPTAATGSAAAVAT